MESININQLVKDEIYYIERKTNKKSRQIGKFKDVTYYGDEKYVANFTDISEIKNHLVLEIAGYTMEMAVDIHTGLPFIKIIRLTIIEK